MLLSERIALLAQLGTYIQQDSNARQKAILLAEQHNGWFTPESCLLAIQAMASQFLQAPILEQWAAHYPAIQQTETHPQTIGLVLAGNIPLVGLHDVIATFICGHKAQIKLSDKDKYLMQYILDFLWQQDERSQAYLQVVPVLHNFDAVIATGANNTAVFFEQYFGKYPHIIRKNRNSVAILTGTETSEELQLLGKDIFRYFGLGCRSVSKLYVPKGYDFIPLMEQLDMFRDLINHNKYQNNYDYNRSIYLINNVPHLANDCVMVLENESLLSRIATIHYEFYEDEADVVAKINAQLSGIQCIVGKKSIANLAVLPLGTSQQPSISDYADNVDTIQFLTSL